jgi:hypothetical protein
MTRGVHLVGALPGDSAQEAMAAALTRLGPYLRTLSDGETGPRSMWIQTNIANLRDHPDVELVQDGALTSYQDIPQFKVKEGHEPTGEALERPLVMADAFRASYPLFKRLRAEHGRPDLAFQVGIPSHVDYAMVAFGPAGLSPAIYGACLEATSRQVNAIQERSDGDVVFQLEMPTALIAIAMAADPDQPATAADMAKRMVELAARAPEGARFGLHLCLGDLNHKALATMGDIRPVVLLSNEIARRWPAGRTLEFVHAPFAAADKPPSFGPAFYEPLRGLALASSTRFAAGFVHEDVALDRSKELLTRIESLLGRRVDVSAACGLGRRPDIAQVWDFMDKAKTLANA